MRVLFAPELYRPDDVTANGTLNDAVTLAEKWLDRDESFHIYWLLSPPDVADYDPEYVRANRERVTLVEAEPFLSGHEYEDAFPETGYTEEQLLALQERIFYHLGYVDVVVDQHVTGRYDLYKWLLENADHREASVTPTSLVANVHDLRLPFKEHGDEYPGDRPMLREMSGALIADRLWFKAGVDIDRFWEYGRNVFDNDTLAELLGDAVETGSPLYLSQFEGSYADEPQTFHVAGSGWGKKNHDVVFGVAEMLYERYGIETVVTNMDPLPKAVEEREFVEEHPEASKEEYHRALKRGDLTVCASDHETMARTPFEQAASRQVLILRDEPWVYDTIPADYRLTGDLDELTSLAVWVVEHWNEAVAANRRLVEHVKEVRSRERACQRTHDDLCSLVADRVRRYPGNEEDDAVQAALADRDGDRVALDELNKRTTAQTADGRPVLDHKGYTVTDLVCLLRSIGYQDTGNPGTPVFAPA